MCLFQLLILSHATQQKVNLASPGTICTIFSRLEAKVAIFFFFLKVLCHFCLRATSIFDMNLSSCTWCPMVIQVYPPLATKKPKQ